MNPWLAILRGLPLTFLMYVSSMLLGAAQAWPSALELNRLEVVLTGPDAARIASYEALLATLPLWRAQLGSLALTCLAYALLSPWLHMAWLSALAEPKGPLVALYAGAHLVPRALVTSLFVALGCLLLLAPWVVGAWQVHAWLEPRANVRMRDVASLLTLSPCIPVLIIGCTWHDLARARCLTGGGFGSAMRSIPDAFHPAVIARYLMWSGVARLLFVGTQLALGSAPFLPAWTAAALLQVAALGRSVARSGWLATAVHYAEPRTPRTARSSHDTRVARRR